MNLHRYLAIAVAALLPASALAAQPPASAAPGAAPCELHLWPAERMRSMSMGLLGGGLIDAAVHAGRDASNRSQMASALDSPTQLDALKSLNLITELGLPEGTTVIRHETPLERHTINSIKTRRAESTARCYYELQTADVFYMKSTLYGRSLRTLFMLRAFGDDQHIDFEYKAWGGNRLHHFPPGEGEDVTVAINELVHVFKANFQEYARNEREAAARRNH